MCSRHEQLPHVIGVGPQWATTNVRQKTTVVCEVRGSCSNKRLMYEPRDVTWLSRCSGGSIGSSSCSSCSSISTQHSSQWCCVGLVSCVWYVVWSVIARHDVAHHPWISHGEKQHILQSSHSDGTPPVSLYLLTYWHCPHSM